MTTPETLRALIAKWRAEGARLDTFHATMGSGYKVCADELEAALLAEAPAPQFPMQFHALSLRVADRYSTYGATAREQMQIDLETLVRYLEGAAAAPALETEQLKNEINDLRHRLEQALTCVYEICGCGNADDGHCMMCCLPFDQHRLIPKGELAEIQRRFEYYSLSRSREEETQTNAD